MTSSPWLQANVYETQTVQPQKTNRFRTRRVDPHAAIAYLVAGQLPSGDSGGQSDRESSLVMDKNVVDLKLENLEHKTDNKLLEMQRQSDLKFSEVMNEIRSLGKDVTAMRSEISDSRRETAAGKFWIVGTGLSIAAIILGALAFGSDRFAAGFDIGDKMDGMIQQRIQTPVTPQRTNNQ